MRGAWLKRGIGAAGRRGIATAPARLNEEKAIANAEAKPMRPKKVHYAKYGLEDSNEPELQRVYEARQEVDKWLYHPTFFNMISEDAMKTNTTGPRRAPPGKGPILRWETCVVFPYDGSSYHPKNRKVKLSVFVRELHLTPMQKRRLVDLVQKRYNRDRDELTLTIQKYGDREDNRKEALRILYALLDEVKNPIASLEELPEDEELAAEVAA